MALSKQSLQLAEWAYWLIFVGSVVAISAVLFKTQRPIAAIVWFIAGLILTYMFYTVYFPASTRSATWPPYISSCPDYLTLLRPNQCVDFVGLNSPLLMKADPQHPPPSNAGAKLIFDASGTTAQKTARAQQYGLSWEGIN